MVTKHLTSAQYHFSSSDLTITAETGSDVMFMVYDAKKNCGGAYLLPVSAQQGADAIEEQILKLLKECKVNGCVPSSLEVKLVGGARLDSKDFSASQMVRKNVTAVEELCKRFGLRISGKAVGGQHRLKVRFNTHSGDVHMQRQAQAQPTSAAPAVSSSAAPAVVKEIRPAVKTGPISVLIIDDSKVIQALFKSALGEDSSFEVFGVATDPLEAEELMKNGQPDVITLDMHMPNMDGLTYLKTHLPARKIPVIMVSGADNKEGVLALQALEHGAVDFVSKPSVEKLREFAPVIKEKIKAASKVSADHLGGLSTTKAQKVVQSSGRIDPDKVVLIGSSTGGTVALTQIFQSLPNQIPPVVVVQHIPAEFSKLLAQRLDSQCPFKVKEAEHGDPVKPNQILIAPGGKQMKMVKDGSGFKVELTDEPEMNRHKPSVDYLFDSAVGLLGARAVALILTGMGKDGARGLKAFKDAGAATAAQDEATSVVFGMPKEAIKIGAANEVLPLDQIAQRIMALVEPSMKKAKQA